MGLRYDVQTPFQAMNDTMSAVTLDSICGMSGLGDGSTFNKCDFFGKRNVGVVPEYVQLTSGTKGYNTDLNNLSPNIGVAWRPNVQDGWLRTILGDPETATVRGGFSVAFERQGLGEFTGQYGANPGSTLALTRSAANNNLVLPGETWPILLSQTGADLPGAVPAVAHVSHCHPERPPGQPQRVRPGHPDRIRAHVDGRPPAIDLTRHGGRHPLRRHARRRSVVGAQLQRARPRVERLLRGVHATR